MGHNPIEIQIQWRCTHCGQPHEQPMAVCMPGGGNSATEPKMVGSGALVCQHCGQLGPMQIGCAIVLGLSIMAGSDGAVHVPLPLKNKSKPDRWVREAGHFSAN